MLSLILKAKLDKGRDNQARRIGNQARQFVTNTHRFYKWWLDPKYGHDPDQYKN